MRALIRPREGGRLEAGGSQVENRHPLARWWQYWLVLVLAGYAVHAASITLGYQRINNFPVKYVSINLRDPNVVVAVACAERFPNGLERWDHFIDRLQPDAAINGTYFSLDDCMPVGDVAVEGNLLYHGQVGTALCITPQNEVAMLPAPRQGQGDWSGYRTVLSAGPRLVQDGEVAIDARAEGFRDPHVLGSAPRSAVVWRPDGLLVFLTIETDISLTNLAYVCQRLGASQAMALDGGSSSALYAEGRTVTRPERGLSNILVAYASRAQYREALRGLYPRQLPIIASLLKSPDTTSLINPLPTQQPPAADPYVTIPVQPPPKVGVRVTTYQLMPLTGAMDADAERALCPVDLRERPAATPRCWRALPEPSAAEWAGKHAPAVRDEPSAPAVPVALLMRGHIPARVSTQSDTPAFTESHVAAPLDAGDGARLDPTRRPVAFHPVAPAAVLPPVTPQASESPRAPIADPDCPTLIGLAGARGSDPISTRVTLPACALPSSRRLPSRVLCEPAAPITPDNMLRISVAQADPLSGVCTVQVEVAAAPEIGMVTLRINGQMRAVTTNRPIAYTWDTTRDADGSYLLEATAWSRTRTQLARETRSVVVRNGR